MSPGREGALPAGPCSVAFFGVKGTRRLAVNGQDRRCFPHAGAGPGKGAAPSVAFHCCVMWGLRRRALHEGRQASPFAHSARVPLRSASVSFSLPAGKSFPRRFSPFFPGRGRRCSWCARPAAWAGALRPLLSVPVMGVGASFFPVSACCCPGKAHVPPAVPPPAVFPTIFRWFSLSCSRRSVHGGLAPPIPRRFSPFFPLSPGRGAWCARPAAWAGALRPLLSVPVMGAGASFFPASACCCPGKVQVPPAVPPPAVFPTIFRCFSLSCSRRSVHGGLAPPFSRRFLRLVPFFRRERGQFVSHTLQRLMPEYFPARRGHPYQAIFLIATPGIFRRAGAPHSTMQNL